MLRKAARAVLVSAIFVGQCLLVTAPYPLQPVALAAQAFVVAQPHCQHDRDCQMCVIIRSPIVITARPDIPGRIR